MTTPKPVATEALPPAPALTFCVTVEDGAAARAFYASALGARELLAIVDDDGSGRLAHAHLEADAAAARVQLYIGSDYRSAGMNAAAARPGARSPAHAYVCVPDVDAAFDRFAKAGAVVTERPKDMPYGMRVGKLVDPFGVGWAFAAPFHGPTPQSVRDEAASFHM